MRKDHTKTSKLLSLVLRHDPAVAGVTLDAQGWVDVDALLAGLAAARRPLALAELEEIVATSDKRRFELSDDGKRIRATQGHSVPVDLGYEDREPPELLYHGTAERNLGSILAQGLRSGQRHAVHLSTDVKTAIAVGQRYGKPVVLVVQAGRMHLDGHRFQCSSNGVWLTEHVPVEYLSQEAARP